MMYVGLDVHKRVCYGTLTDQDGNVLKRGRFSSSPEGLRAFMVGVDETKIAMEAGYCWQPLIDALKEKGYDVRLAHPQRVKAIAEAKVKTDKVDSETLAHLLRANLLPESYVPPMDIRELREMVRRRSFLVGMRTKLKNRIHAELAKRGIDLETPLFTRRGRELLRSLSLEAVDQLLPVMDALDVQIICISGSLRRMSGEDLRAQLLTTIPGVGYYVAMLIVSEIGDVNRFPSAEKLCGYSGLVPRVRNSGDSVRHGGITRDGSRWLRWALTPAVLVHVRWAEESELSGFYRRLAARKTKQEAVIATARKMLKVVFWMLRGGEPYHSGGLEPALGR